LCWPALPKFVNFNFAPTDVAVLARAASQALAVLAYDADRQRLNEKEEEEREKEREKELCSNYSDDVDSVSDSDDEEQSSDSKFLSVDGAAAAPAPAPTVPKVLPSMSTAQTVSPQSSTAATSTTVGVCARAPFSSLVSDAKDVLGIDLSFLKSPQKSVTREDILASLSLFKDAPQMVFEPMLEKEFAYTVQEVKLNPENEAAVLKLAKHYLASEDRRAAFNCLAECTTKVQASG
jgi:hypothetical protein